MKRILLFISCLTFCLNSYSGETNNFNKFLGALGVIESNNNDFAIGDNGKARGRYQIWYSYFKDAQDYDKSLNKYSYSDLTNKIVSDKVVKAYLNRYCPAAVKNNDFETMSRIHNGGPRGNKKESTLKYWKKFEKEIAKE